LVPGGPGAGIAAPRLLIAITAGGLAGALVDSLLGGTVQGAYAAADGTEVPDDLVRLGRRGRLVRGWRWVTNDAVNLAATVTGAAVAATMT
ncbi:MAG: DUF92 domain-containing protein, partial [Chloroflexota bacterium]|nr:DUF92 domain-containing protein [Chloroflexota bacterium]